MTENLVENSDIFVSSIVHKTSEQIQPNYSEIDQVPSTTSSTTDGEIGIILWKSSKKNYLF